MYNHFVEEIKIILRVFLIFSLLLPAEGVLASLVQFLSFLLICLQRLVISKFVLDFRKEGGGKRLMDIYTYSYLYAYLYFTFM